MQRIGGWWRLWIVSTIISGVVLFTLQFAPRQRDIVEVKSYPTLDAMAQRAVEAAREVRPRCVPTSYIEMPMQHSSGEFMLAIACRSWASLLRIIGISIVPGAVLLVLGLTVQWVRIGFRSRRPNQL